MVIEVMRNPATKPASALAAAQPQAATKSQDKQQDQTAQKAENTAPTPAETDRLAPLADGAPIGLTLDEDIPPDAEEGHPLHFTVAADLKTSDGVLIAKGSKAVGMIYSREKRKTIIMKRGDKVNFQLASVTAASGAKLKVRATPQRKANEDSYRAIDSKSKDIAATKGTHFIGYIDGAQTVMTKRP